MSTKKKQLEKGNINAFVGVETLSELNKEFAPAANSLAWLIAEEEVCVPDQFDLLGIDHDQRGQGLHRAPGSQVSLQHGEQQETETKVQHNVQLDTETVGRGEVVEPQARHVWRIPVSGLIDPPRLIQKSWLAVSGKRSRPACRRGPLAACRS